MRKAYGALLALGLIFLYMLPGGARADSARDSLVNPGNAQHLGDSVKSAGSGKAEKQEPKEADKAEAPNTEGRATHPDDEVSPEEEPAAEGEAAEAPTGEAEPDGAAAEETSTEGATSEMPCECATTCGTLEFFGPMAVINQHPPNLLFLSPAPEQAAVLARGRSYFKLRLDQTNVIIREQDSGTIADYDFETTRLSAEYALGLGRGEASIKLPFIYRGHGILDHVIYEWHNFFGMPNGLRTRFPDQQYRYTIISQQGAVFNDDGDSMGLGDLSLGYKYPLWNRRDGEDAASLRAMVKLPTGSADSATGSGNVDFSLGALYQRQLTPHIRAYVNADWVFTGKPDWTNIRQQDMLITNWIAEYAISHRTTLLAQYRTNRNPLRIGSTQADKDAQELILGFNHRLGRNVVWSGGFVEDINPETAPDWTMTTDFKWEF